MVGNGDRRKLGVVAPPTPELAFAVAQGTFDAIQSHLGRAGVARHRRHLNVGLRAADHVGQHVEMLGHAHRPQAALIVAALLDKHAAKRLHARRLADPAHQRLVPDAQAQHIVATQVGILPPVQRAVAVEKAIAVAHAGGQHFAQVAFGQQPPHSRVGGQGVGRRHDLRDQIGAGAGGVAHGAGFGQVHGHARLAQHMLASGKCGQRGGSMHVGPGADHHRVEIGGDGQFLPALVDLRNTKALGHPLRRGAAAVAHGGDCHAGDGLQVRDVPRDGIAARANHAYANFLHRHAPFRGGFIIHRLHRLRRQEHFYACPSTGSGEPAGKECTFLCCRFSALCGENRQRGWIANSSKPKVLRRISSEIICAVCVSCG